jgi:hypothetical protein
MELDDLKNSWQHANDQPGKQQQLSPAMIEQVTQAKYRSGINKIAYPEIAGILVCLAGVVFVLFNFGKLNTVFLKGTGILSVLVLAAVSVISLLSIRQFNLALDMGNPYTDALKAFAIQKIRFHKFQRLNFILCHLLMVTVIILLSAFFGKQGIASSKYFLTFSFSLGYLFLLFYSKGVFRHYNNSLRRAEELLKEVKE